MTSGGAEALKLAIRRSLPIIIGLVVLGIVAVNAFEQLRGARYDAKSNVEVSSVSPAQIVTGTTSPFVDPTQIQSTAQTLAEAPQVYRLAAARTDYRYGRAEDLRNATAVSAVNNTELLSFTANATSPDVAVAISNATANAYVSYRAQLTSRQISDTINRLQSTFATLSPNSPQRSQLQSEIGKLQLLRATSGTGATVAEPALAASKTSPKPLRDSLIGLGIGLVVALLLVALREAIDTTVRTENEVEDVLAAPVLTSIRSLPRRTELVTIGRYEPLFGDAYALLAAQLAPDDRDAERTVVAITSAVAGEGKTITAANLAVSLALRGERVVLADLDFRRPTLESLFGIPPQASGAFQVLTGTDTVDAALWEVALEGPKPVARRRADPHGISDGGVESRSPDAPAPTNGRARGAGSLIVLPSGKSGGVKRVRTARLESLVRELAAAVPIVILDTPPALLTAEMTELARLIEMVVVVVRQGKVSHRALRSLSRHVRSWNADVTGAVLTDVPPTATYGSYYRGR